MKQGPYKTLQNKKVIQSGLESWPHHLTFVSFLSFVYKCGEPLLPYVEGGFHEAGEEEGG